ncbi:hypothetical protein [Desulfotomaculum nigrificans]|uniref:hypothetical protein n=1 Tax=Desulfotomaculum nigrificans TaxID=1565 RepID=UPI0001FAE77E|nr:hypothetical protein [Desulfotomaculum nigrificans]MDA8235900.1 hypothetical protein [Clostridia bacterium]
MKVNNKWLLILLIVALGIAIVGVANADTTNSSQADQTATVTVTPAVNVATTVTPDQVKQMIQNCWQLNQAMIDQWSKVTGLTKDDLLKMEMTWMQAVMQQNPSLSLQDAVKMEQTWMMNSLTNYQSSKQIQTTQIQQTQTQQAPQQNLAPQNPPQQQVYPRSYNGNRQYYGWNCPWNYNYCW